MKASVHKRESRSALELTLLMYQERVELRLDKTGCIKCEVCIRQCSFDVHYYDEEEDIIKHQWNCKTTPYWTDKSKELNFLMIMHEHLFVFRKPKEGERTGLFQDSMAW